MYQIGNLIFYESSGVCKVMGVTMRDLTGQNKEQLYYVLEPLYQNYIIFTLVNAYSPASGQGSHLIRPDVA